MKKAQWKQSPRDRVYNEDPRDKLNRELSTALAEATHKIEQQKVVHAALEQRLSLKNKALSDADKVRSAYRYLRHKGVVVEHEKEFKHLQGADMDEFFEVEEPGPFWRVPHSGPLTTGALVQDMLDSINTSFDLAYGSYTRSAR